MPPSDDDEDDSDDDDDSDDNDENDDDDEGVGNQSGATTKGENYFAQKLREITSIIVNREDLFPENRNGLIWRIFASYMGEIPLDHLKERASSGLQHLRVSFELAFYAAIDSSGIDHSAAKGTVFAVTDTSQRSAFLFVEDKMRRQRTSISSSSAGPSSNVASQSQSFWKLDNRKSKLYQASSVLKEQNRDHLNTWVFDSHSPRMLFFDGQKWQTKILEDQTHAGPSTPIASVARGSASASGRSQYSWT